MLVACALCAGPWGHEVNSPPLLFSGSPVCGRGAGSFRTPLGPAVPLGITERRPLGADILLGKQKMGWISAPPHHFEAEPLCSQQPTQLHMVVLNG